MIKEIGKYNVDFEGISYDGKIPYEMVIIEEFAEGKPVKGSKKTLYFRGEKNYIMPVFSTEEAVEMYLQYANNTKLQIFSKVVVEEVHNSGRRTRTRGNSVQEAMKVLRAELLRHGDLYNGFQASIESSVKEQQVLSQHRNSDTIAKGILRRIIGEE